MAAYDRGPQCAGVIGLFLGLTWIFFCMRMYVKAFLTRSWGVDDLFLIIAIALFTTYCICGALGVKYGTGRHTAAIPLEDIPKGLHFWFLCEIFYTLTTAFIRLSIAIFLVRITFRRLYRVIIYITMTAITAFSIFYFFLILFQCSPVSYFWNVFKGAKGHCMNASVIPDASIAHSAVSFTADWVLGLLPITLIWTLKMNRRTKISLACILAIGLLAGIAAIIRIPYIKVLTSSQDFLYATTDVAIWSTVEAGLGIVAASAYTLRPLFRSLLSSRGSAAPSKPSRTPSGGLKKNTSRSATGLPSQQQQQQQPQQQELSSPTSYPGAILGAGGDAENQYPVPAAAGTHSPWEDSSEDNAMRGGADTNTSSNSDARGIQVQRSFSVHEEEDGEGEEEEEGEGKEERSRMPWRRKEGMGSSTSIV